MEGEKQYIAIDLKSFYASQECIERELDPLTTNLVVADLSRTVPGAGENPPGKILGCQCPEGRPLSGDRFYHCATPNGALYRVQHQNL